MVLPFFYIDHYEVSRTEIELSEETSRHIVQVLRMKKGQQLRLTDGKGNLITAAILDDHKKHCVVTTEKTQFTPQDDQRIAIGISLLKNASRFEWFLEKATELGVDEIIPLLCERTEKEKFRYERLKGICISAMLQSQQTWLPDLREPVAYSEYVTVGNFKQKMIAHCIEEIPRKSLKELQPFNSSLLLIGPEGDFTGNEVRSAIDQQYIPVTLGNTRLRTETAALVAATLLLRS